MATAKTETKTVLIVDAQTGESEVVPMTAEELAQLAIENQQSEAIKAAAEAKALARQSALAKLAELGLTEEEIAAL